MANSHKRPLPPPQSREAVCKQIDAVLSWEVVDDDHEVQIGSVPKYRKLENGKRVVKRSRWDSPESITQPRSEGLSDIGNHSVLGTTENALIEPIATKPASTDSSDPEVFNNGQMSDEEMAMQLALLTCSRVPQGEAFTPRVESHIEADNQVAYADQERSRALREQNIAEREKRREQDASKTSSGVSTPQTNDESVLRDSLGGQESLYGSTYSEASPIVSDAGLLASEQLEAELDYVQQYVEHKTSDIEDAQEMGVSEEGEVLSPNEANDSPHDISKTTPEPHPASRAAAEQWRTQNRHLTHRNDSSDTNLVRQIELDEGARRLRKIISSNSKQKDAPKTRFVQRVYDDTSREPNHQASLAPLATYTTQEVKPNSLSSQMFSGITPKRDVSTDKNEDMYKTPGTDIHLPRNFSRVDQERQDIVIKHEIFKEREKDLNTILSAFRAMASYSTLKALGETESSELSFLLKFLNKVVKEKLSGKAPRQRVRDIEQNLKRRMGKLPSGNQAQALMLFEKWIGLDVLQAIDEEQAQLKEEIEILRVQRMSLKHLGPQNRPHRTKSHKTKKQVSFLDSDHNGTSQMDAEISKRSMLDLSDEETLGTKTKTTTAKKRAAQIAYQDRYEEKLRARLQAFDTHVQPLENGDDESLDRIDSRNTENGQLDADEELESEEDEGNEFYAGTQAALAGTSPDQPLNDEAYDRARKSAQSWDDRLLQSLQKKKQQNEIRDEQGVQQVDYDLVSSMIEKRDLEADAIEQNEVLLPDTEFDDMSDVEDDGSDDEGDVKLCFRYSVKATYFGIKGREDGAEYRHGDFLDSARAAKKLTAITNKTLKVLEKTSCQQDLENREIRFTSDNGTQSQFLWVGQDKSISCHVWFDREEYEPSKEAYENAKVKRACNASPTYAVLWEKTISPKMVENEAEQDARRPPEQQIAEKEITRQNSPEEPISVEDLFGSPSKLLIPESTPKTQHPPAHPSTKPNPPVFNTITTTIPISNIQHFTTTSLANRHAKTVFTAWWLGHLRGPNNHAYIRTEDDFMEEELQGLGDRGVWGREEEFAVEYDDDRDGNEGGKVEVLEKLHVWVQEFRQIGPAN